MASTYLDRVGNKALGQMLVDKGALRDEQVSEALDFARERGIRLGEALVEMGFIGTDALSYAIAEQYGQRPMELHPSMVDEGLLRGFDAAMLWRHVMLPLIELENELVVVVADPNDQAGLDALSAARPGMRIVPQLAGETQICRCLEAVFPGVAKCNSDMDSGGGMKVRQLSEFAEVPRPGSVEFVEWLLSSAAEYSGDEVVLRRRGAGMQAWVAGGSADGERWESVNFAAMLRPLLARATAIPFTQNQAWRLTEQVGPGGDVFHFLVLTPVAAGEPFVRVRARRRDDAAVPAAGTEIFSEKIDSIITAGAGECLAVEVPSEKPGPAGFSARDLAEDFARKGGDQRQIVLVTHGVAPAADRLAAYPAGVTNVVAAAHAHGAQCVVFDHVPGAGEAARIMAAVDPPPAVVVFYQPPAEAGRDGDGSAERRDAAPTLSDGLRDAAAHLPGMRWLKISDLIVDGGVA